jgi:hypothetical protein
VYATVSTKKVYFMEKLQQKVHTPFCMAEAKHKFHPIRLVTKLTDFFYTSASRSHVDRWWAHRHQHWIKHGAHCCPMWWLQHVSHTWLALQMPGVWGLWPVQTVQSRWATCWAHYVQDTKASQWCATNPSTTTLLSFDVTWNCVMCSTINAGLV